MPEATPKHCQSTKKARLSTTRQHNDRPYIIHTGRGAIRALVHFAGGRKKDLAVQPV